MSFDILCTKEICCFVCGVLLPWIVEFLSHLDEIWMGIQTINLQVLPNLTCLLSDLIIIVCCTEELPLAMNALYFKKKTMKNQLLLVCIFF